MYNNLVHPATNFLDGLCTRNLQTVAGMTIAAKLKAIRESLPRKLSVRDMATRMGKPDVPNTYGYYESAKFNKAALPLDKARLFAEAFAEHGGDPREVLALAGLEAADVEDQAQAIAPAALASLTISLPVSLPSGERLTDMMAGMLDAADLPHLVDEYAERLAQLLPTALAEAAAPADRQEKVRSTRTSSLVPDRATADRDKRQ